MGETYTSLKTSFEKLNLNTMLQLGSMSFDGNLTKRLFMYYLNNPQDPKPYLDILKLLLELKGAEQGAELANQGVVVVVEPATEPDTENDTAKVKALESEISGRLDLLSKLKEYPKNQSELPSDFLSLRGVLSTYMDERLPALYNESVAKFNNLRKGGNLQSLQALSLWLMNDVEYEFSLVQSAVYMFQTRDPAELGMTREQVTIWLGCINKLFQDQSAGKDGDVSSILETLNAMVSFGLARGMCNLFQKGWYKNYKFRQLLDRLIAKTRSSKKKEFFQTLMSNLSGLCSVRSSFSSASCIDHLSTAKEIMNNLAKLCKVLLTSTKPKAKERFLNVPWNAEKLLEYLSALEEVYYRNQSSPSSSVSFSSYFSAKNLALASLFLTGAFFLGKAALSGASGVSQNVSVPGFNRPIPEMPSYHDTCPSFPNINTETLQQTSFVLVGNQTSGISTALRCIRPDVFVVDISPITKVVNSIQKTDDFVNYVLSQASKLAVDVVYSEPKFFNPSILVESLCKYFPENATQSDISKLATLVKKIVDTTCNNRLHCNVSLNSTTILEPTKNLGNKGALEILSRTKPFFESDFKSEEPLVETPKTYSLDLLMELSKYIKYVTGKPLTIRLDASNLKADQSTIDRLANFALTHEIQGSVMDRDFLYQYAFPEGTYLPMENQKLPIQNME